MQSTYRLSLANGAHWLTRCRGMQLFHSTTACFCHSTEAQSSTARREKVVIASLEQTVKYDCPFMPITVQLRMLDSAGTSLKMTEYGGGANVGREPNVGEKG